MSVIARKGFKGHRVEVYPSGRQSSGYPGFPRIPSYRDCDEEKPLTKFQEGRMVGSPERDDLEDGEQHSHAILIWRVQQRCVRSSGIFAIAIRCQ